MKNLVKDLKATAVVSATKGAAFVVGMTAATVVINGVCKGIDRAKSRKEKNHKKFKLFNK